MMASGNTRPVFAKQAHAAKLVPEAIEDRVVSRRLWLTLYINSWAA